MFVHDVMAEMTTDPSPRPLPFRPAPNASAKLSADPRERDAILRPARPRQARHDGGEVEVERLGVGRLGLRPVAEEPLLTRVALDQLDVLGGAAGVAQVPQGLAVDGERRRRRAELGRHVRDRRAVGDGERAQAGAEELDELADDAVPAQPLGHREHEVGGRDAARKAAREAHADDLRSGHVDRLAEHDRLGLDAADAPAEHPERVDHRGVRVGADQRVGHRDAVADRHDRAEVLEVHLMDDPHPGRDDPEVPERSLRPSQERVALAVSGVLALDVALVGAGRAERIDLHRVVDHEIDRHLRVDTRRVAAAARHRRPERRQVDDGRDAGQVLHDHARGHERELRTLRRRRPVGERAHVGVGHMLGPGPANEVLEEDADRVRQARRVRDRIDAMDHLAGHAHSLAVGTVRPCPTA